MGNISLSVVEIIILQLGALLIGVVIQFFVVTRKRFKKEIEDLKNPPAKKNDTWAMDLLEDIEEKKIQIAKLQKDLNSARENENIYQIEIEELNKENKAFRSERREQPLQGTAAVAAPSADKGSNYMQQLREAQESLLEHNEKINKLLGQIDIVKETEERQNEIERRNEELKDQIGNLKFLLKDKEEEMLRVKQKENMTKEMTSMLDSAYSEFEVLQGKMLKLESQLAGNKRIGLDFEDLKETYYKLNNEHEHLKTRYQAITAENQQLHGLLDDTEEKLHDANFQKQQLQKRVAYLEELSNDLQMMSEANKKLEGQIKKIGELESRLNIVSEERDSLEQKVKGKSGS
jgi:DNA repair exonuclease SbcCD ATPase subunit